MPARSARGENYVVKTEQLVVSQVETAKLRGSRVIEKPATHRVLDRLRLLEYLLEHEVLISTALDLPQIPVYLAHAAPHLARVDVEHAIAITIQHRNVPVVQIHHLASMRKNCGHITCHVILPFTQPEQQRASLTGRDELIWISTGHHSDSVR